MKIKKLWILSITLFVLTACDSGHKTTDVEHPAWPSVNLDVKKETTTAGVILEGGDQGREGGHYVICPPEAGIPDARSEFELKKTKIQQKIVFLDYFIGIDTQEKRNALEDFILQETDDQRLDRVAKRLFSIFNEVPHMHALLDRIIQYSTSFMEIKGRVRWIENLQQPYEFELTEDVTPDFLSPEKLETLNETCHDRFFQAAVYDYSNKGEEVFYYSQFFEDKAPIMQRSYRNVHELLRYLMRNESKQVIQLTNYFHTQEFFDADVKIVREKIKEISRTYKRTRPFFEEKADGPRD